MNKQELRDDKVAAGWGVPQPDALLLDAFGNQVVFASGPYQGNPVPAWLPVSRVNNIVKYDVGVIRPDGQFVQAQVVVTDDGGPTETAVPFGQWVDAVVPASTFAERLREYLDTIEALAAIFAVATTQTFDADAVALCNAYKTDGSVATYVVIERAGVFTKQLLT